MVSAGNSDEIPVKIEDHEDSQKIKVPDPSMDEEHKEEPEVVQAPGSSEGEDTTMMEGAWADILGSGQLKKKVRKKGLKWNFSINTHVTNTLSDHTKGNTKYQTNQQ